MMVPFPVGGDSMRCNPERTCVLEVSLAKPWLGNGTYMKANTKLDQ